MNWLADLVQPLLSINPWWALVALMLQLANLCCRSLTWRNVLAGAYPDADLPAHRVGLAYAVGCALNGYLPARGGEAVKVALVRMQLPTTSTVAVASSCSVVLVFDSIVGISLLTAGWAFGALPAPPPVPVPIVAFFDAPLAMLGASIAVIGLTTLLVRRYGTRVRGVATQLGQGVAVLRTPGRYVRTVLTFQSLAWCCRIGVVYCLLHAFGIAATLPLAALVVVVGGLSTAVPVPGGAGTQQALAVFVLSTIAATSTALSFSIGMQVGITLVNTTIGVIAAMLLFGRLHPVAALRQALAAARLRPALAD